MWRIGTWGILSSYPPVPLVKPLPQAIHLRLQAEQLPKPLTFSEVLNRIYANQKEIIEAGADLEL